MPSIQLHLIPASHPCRAVEEAVAIKGIEVEKIVSAAGEHNAVIAEHYGADKRTAPGMLVDGEPFHGSRAITAKLEEIAPEPPLFPEPIADAVREAERWGDEELQGLGRWLTWGAMHFRPEYFATYGGGDLLDPAGTDFAIKFIRASWKYHSLTAEKVASGLASLPAKLDHADSLVAAGTIGGEAPNAADLQIGSTLRILMTVGDVAPLIESRPCGEMARKVFPEYAGEVAAGAYPAAWLPAAG